MLRVRNSEAKCNAPSSYNNTHCVAVTAGCSGDDTDRHIFTCIYMGSPGIALTDLCYDDIFSSDITKLYQIQLIMQERFRKDRALSQPSWDHRIKLSQLWIREMKTH